jgi:uncharacterized protein (TIGR00725 family)
VIGNGQASDESCRVAEEVGRLLIEDGFRLVTGGLGGVMEAASRGARGASRRSDADVIGILPGSDPTAANPYVDIVIPSGMGYARNVLIVQTAEAVIAIGGGAGTLSEIALAWQADRALIALAVEGFSGEWAGRALDARARAPIARAASAAEAVSLVGTLLGLSQRPS